MTPTQQARARQALDERFAQIAPVIGRRPPAGWVRAVREALGMSGVSLAERLAVTGARVTQIEQAEVRGDIKLSTLERAADALGCDLVYAFIPRSGSLEKDVVTQSRSKAAAQVKRAAHTMALEGQAAQPDDVLIDTLAERIARSSQLWR